MIVQLFVFFFFFFIPREKRSKGGIHHVLAPVPLKIERIAMRGSRKVEGVNGREAANESADTARLGEIFWPGGFL